MEVKIIKDSVNSLDQRITTIEATYPRFIHSQVLTHRMFSRNSSSSRAIPTLKVIQSIINNPINPFFGKNKPGMQAEGEVENVDEVINIWNESKENALTSARQLLDFNLHKQLLNRILEPYSNITTIITATDWDNFLQLRLHETSQPEIQELAVNIKHLLDNSNPYERTVHLPYIDEWDSRNSTEEDNIKVSVARCARVSYLNHDGTTSSKENDFKLYNKLLEYKHLSPFEHIAFDPYKTDKKKGYTHLQLSTNKMYSGNFKQWIQYRQLLEERV